jgi:glycosyltransferase involved in cell wall biosynthesis
MATIAVVTPVYATPVNGRLDMLDLTIRSVLKQNYQKFVHIVVDDGSTADVKGMLQQFRDPRIRYVHRTRNPSDIQTASNAINLGLNYCIEKSREVFSQREADELKGAVYLHSDDILTNESMRRRLEMLTSGFVFTDMAIFTNQGLITDIRKGDANHVNDGNLLALNYALFNHHTTMWSIDFLQFLRDFVDRKYEQEGIFDPLLFCGEDRDVTLSSSEAAIEGNFQATYIPMVSVMYRLHDKSITGERNEGLVQKQINYILQKHFHTTDTDTTVIVNRLFSNLPWSLGAYLPPHLKDRFRPIRNRFQDLRLHLTHPKIRRTLEQCLH